MSFVEGLNASLDLNFCLKYVRYGFLHLASSAVSDAGLHPSFAAPVGPQAEAASCAENPVKAVPAPGIMKAADGPSGRFLTRVGFLRCTYQGAFIGCRCSVDVLGAKSLQSLCA